MRSLGQRIFLKGSDQQFPKSWVTMQKSRSTAGSGAWELRFLRAPPGGGWIHAGVAGGVVHLPHLSCQVRSCLGRRKVTQKMTHQPTAKDVEVITGENGTRVG